MNKIPFTWKEVRVTKLDQYKPEFKKVNPNAKVPAITDGDLNMFESHTILRYLHETRKTADHWYPREDLRKRAKVDEYLDWHHNGLRLGAGGYIFRKYVSPLTGKPAPKEAIEESLLLMRKALKLMDTYFLKTDQQPYLLGNELTLADISAACEVAQIKASQHASVIQDFPRVSQWLDRMLALPELKEVHEKVLPLLKKAFQRVDENTDAAAKL